jgi:MEMO1 family protein
VTDTAYPRLRALEAFPVEHQGQPCIALRDPAGFTDQIAVLPPLLLDLVSLFDGEHSIAGIQEVMRRRHGEAPTHDQIEAVIDRFDQAGFLETERFAARRRGLEEAFRRSPVRPASHAGGAYEGDPERLTAQIEAFFSGPGGPDHPESGPVDGHGAGGLTALIAPHIDFHRGGPTYGWAYKAVLDRSDADLYVILGTCHAGMTDPFALTLKPYDTPLGPVPVDRDFYEGLAARAGQDLLASELAHRSEHSIEFQAVLLRYLARQAGGPERRIVPLLASFANECLVRGESPRQDSDIEAVLAAVGDAMATVPRRYCIVAGADLAHVGPRFGDEWRVTAPELARVERDDRTLLAPVVSRDADGFFAEAQRQQDRNRVCGLSPIYALLRLMPGGRGRLLRYGQWPDPDGAVTFASLSFETEAAPA